MDLVENVEFAEALMDRFLDIRLAMAGRALQEVGEEIDIVMVTSDDLGMTDRPLVSPALYRSLIKPRQKRTFDFFRARTGARLYCHTDGAVYPLIPDLIEIGVDALNPIEVSAVGMGDTRKLKREFGEKLTFWGAIDTPPRAPLRDTPGGARGGPAAHSGPRAGRRLRHLPRPQHPARRPARERRGHVRRRLRAGVISAHAIARSHPGWVITPVMQPSSSYVALGYSGASLRHRRLSSSSPL